MEFESVSNLYRVIQVLRQADGFQTCLCDCQGEETVLVWFFSPQLREKLYPLFVQIQEQGELEDLKDVFPWEDGFAAVFHRYRLDQSLAQITQNPDSSYQEKLELLQSILVGLCIRSIPVFLAGDLIQSGNAGICTDGNPGFFYDLQHPEQYAGYTMGAFLSTLTRAVERLFQPQIKEGSAGELLAFCDGLAQHQPKDFLELYRRFQPVKESLDQKLAQGKLTPQTRGIQAWKWLKKGVSVGKKLLVAAVLVLAAWFLIAMLFQNNDTGQPAFQSIGTVQMEV